MFIVQIFEAHLIIGQEVRRKKRGVESDWKELEAFETREEYERSEIPALLKTTFTLRSGKGTSSEVYHCRFARKKGFNCGKKVKVVFSEADDSVTVDEVGGDHNHDVVAVEEVEGSNLRWTSLQTKVVMTGVLNEASPTVIRRNLKEHFPEGKMPSAIQIAGNKGVPPSKFYQWGN